jgi:hypothetical protein
LRTTFLSMVVTIAFAHTASAQVNEKFADLTDEIEMVRTMARGERQALVTEAMYLTPEESQRFWPVYHEYRSDLTKINDRVVKLITDYAASFETLTDAQAKTLLNDMMAVQGDTVSLRKKYIPRFAKVLPMTKVTRFYQIENKLDTVQNLTFVTDVPLAR